MPHVVDWQYVRPIDSVWEEEQISLLLDEQSIVEEDLKFYYVSNIFITNESLPNDCGTTY